MKTSVKRLTAMFSSFVCETHCYRCDILVHILVSCHDSRQTIVRTIHTANIKQLKKNMKLEEGNIRAWNLQFNINNGRRSAPHKTIQLLCDTKEQCLTTKLALSCAIIKNTMCILTFVCIRFFFVCLFVLVYSGGEKMKSKWKGFELRTKQMIIFHLYDETERRISNECVTQI